MAIRASQCGWTRGYLLTSLMCLWLWIAGSALAAPVVPPTPSERVTDRVGVMSSESRSSLEQRLTAYEQRSGHQVIVWIDRSTGDEPIETFAVEAFEAWKLGSKQLDDGLALFVMTEDQTIRIEVGYGLEPTITDLVAARVISQTMIPAIERGDWDAAVVGGVEQLVDTIEGQPGSLPQATAEQPGPTTESRWSRIAKMVGMALAGALFLILLIKNPGLALLLLTFLGRGRGGGNDSGFGGGGGGSSGGGGATGRW
jgi:uncharacterized protein